MADYTHIKFTQINSQDIDVLVNSNIAIVNEWYPYDAVFSIKKKNTNDFGEPYTTIRYKAKNTTLESNESEIKISLIPDKNILPIGLNSNLTILNNSEINLLPLFDINDATDRIKIIDIIGEGKLFLNSNEITINDIISRNNIKNLKFKSFEGGGNPYFKLIYRAMNIDNEALQTTSIMLNIDSLAELSLIKEESNLLDDNGIGYKDIDGSLLISSAYVNSTIELEITVLLSNSAFPVNTSNSLSVDYPDTNTTSFNQNGTNVITVNSDNNGKAIVLYNLIIDILDLPVSGTILFKILSVNNDVSLVSNNNEYIINVNL